MSGISESVCWRIFNIPSVEPVQYFTILKKKREFDQLIEQYESKISKHGCMHYSCIVPSSKLLNVEDEIFVLFFDEIISNVSFIGFKIKINKKSCIQETNFLLWFLKASQKEILYEMRRNYIYVQCKTSDIWTLFYQLYDKYLRQYILTVIGTQFFYYFVYSYFIQKDIQLLQMLYKGLQVIKISRKSLVFDIHQKRGISVAGLKHMLAVVPRSNIFRASNSISKILPRCCSRFRDWKLHIPVERKIISALRQRNIEMEVPNIIYSIADSIATNEKMAFPLSGFKEFSLNETCKSHSYFKEKLCHSVPVKRKLQEIENVVHESVPSTCKLFKPTDVETHVNKWEKYFDFKPLVIKNYSEISFINHLDPNLINSGSENNYFSSFRMNGNPHDVSFQNSISKLRRTCSKNLNDTNTFEMKENVLDAAQMYYRNVRVSRNNILKAISLERSLSEENINLLFGNTSDVGFLTAAGKAVNVSYTAMLTAYNVMKDAFIDDPSQIKETTSAFKVNKNTNAFTDYVLSKEFSAEIQHNKSSEFVPFTNMKFTGENKMVIGPSNNAEFDYFHSSQNSDFKTGAGKTLCVSSASLMTANKLLQEVMNDESETVVGETSVDACNSKLYSDPCTSKSSNAIPKFVFEESNKIDVEKHLAENFFKETFDDKKLESVMYSNDDQPVHVGSDENSDTNLVTYKPRKSLGGRRSKRCYSNKL